MFKNLMKNFKTKKNWFPKRNYACSREGLLGMRIKRDEILSAPSTPLISPSYPFGPYRFVDREYMIISYETDPEALRRVVPYPLQPAPGNVVMYGKLKYTHYKKNKKK